MGQLRHICYLTAKRLKSGEAPKDKLNLIDYTPEQWKDKLLKNFSFESLNEACDSGYELDHIVPISYIAKNIEDQELQFRVAMDLKNQRLLIDIENRKKYARINLPEVQEIIKYLRTKYNVTL